MNLAFVFRSMALAAVLAVITGVTRPAAAAFDLVAEQTISASTINVGETVTITVTFRNNGPDVSPASLLRLVPEQRWEIISASNGTLYVDAEQQIQEVAFTDVQLAAGESTSTQVVLKALQGGTLQSYVECYYTPLDPPQETNFTNNQNFSTVIVRGDIPIYDLALSYGTSTANVQPGGLLALDLYVKNNGPEDCTSAMLQIMKTPFQHSGIRFGDMELHSIQDAGSWTFVEEAYNLIGTLPFLAAGDITTVTLVFRIVDQPNNASVMNQSAVWSQVGADVDSTNDRVNINVPITTTDDNQGTDLEVTRAVPGEVAISQPFTYTVQAVNRGPNPTARAYVGNVVPDNLRVVAVSADKGMAGVLGNYVELDNVALAVGEAATLQVTVVPEVLGDGVLGGGGASDGFDSNLANNFLNEAIKVSETGPDDSVDPVPCVDTPDLVSKVTEVKRRGKFKKKQSQWQYTIQAKVEISNVGMACAPKSTVWFYLSNDMVLDGSDTLIGGKNVGKVCPGKKPKKTKLKAKLPLGLNPVGCYVIAVADGENIVAECSETNNSAFNY